MPDDKCPKCGAVRVGPLMNPHRSGSLYGCGFSQEDDGTIVTENTLTCLKAQLAAMKEENAKLREERDHPCYCCRENDGAGCQPGCRCFPNTKEGAREVARGEGNPAERSIWEPPHQDEMKPGKGLKEQTGRATSPLGVEYVRGDAQRPKEWRKCPECGIWLMGAYLNSCWKCGWATAPDTKEQPHDH